MRRDMDLVREILGEAAESAGPFDASSLTDGSHPLVDVAYQVELMRQAGLVKAPAPSTADLFGAVRDSWLRLCWLH